MALIITKNATYTPGITWNYAIYTPEMIMARITTHCIYIPEINDEGLDHD